MKKATRKQYDKAIKESVGKICQLATTWGIVVRDMNEDAATDRLIDEITEEAETLKRLQEERFELMANGE